MPTILPRVQVTVTAALDEALSAARDAWPGMPRSEAISRLALLGRETLTAATQERRQARRDALAATSGVLKDAYPPGYLAEVRADWPA